jgi:hypothetical protein
MVDFHEDGTEFLQTLTVTPRHFWPSDIVWSKHDGDGRRHVRQLSFGSAQFKPESIRILGTKLNPFYACAALPYYQRLVRYKRCLQKSPAIWPRVIPFGRFETGHSFAFAKGRNAPIVLKKSVLLAAPSPDSVVLSKEIG